MTNINGTQSVLDGAVNHKIDLFLQISTDEVYGSLDDTGYFTIAPSNPYKQVQICSASYSNTYGPAQYPEKLISMIIRMH